MMNLACTLFRLTPDEALRGFTVHAARALGLQAGHGSLRPGLRADVACGRPSIRRAGLSLRLDPGRGSLVGGVLHRREAP
jgi:cytosine/adenosine deaminase-related metal-dependent hydrolase